MNPIINNRDTKLPYVELGKTIELRFEEKFPDAYELKDYILEDNGNPKYTEQTIQSITMKKHDNGKGSFTLEGNWAVNLSSDSKDYEPRATIRGFHLTCSWDGNMCEYAFIIRTDPTLK